MLLSIIIPTLFSKKSLTLINECLEKLENSLSFVGDKQLEVNIFIYANYLKSGEIAKNIQEKLSKKVSFNVCVINNTLNIGFTGAVNKSLEYILEENNSEWFLVLNDDALVKKDFFRTLLPRLKSVVSGIVSCGVEDNRGRIESFGLSYNKTGLAFPNKRIRKTNYFCGTCFFVSRRVVKKQIKDYGYFFNPLFFAYAEDLELSIRIKNDNVSIFIEDKVLLVHKVSETAKRGSFFQLYYGYRNLLWTVILTWSLKKIFRNTFFIFFGQVYVFMISLKKGYFSLYPRIIKETILTWDKLFLMRQGYQKKFNKY